MLPQTTLMGTQSMNIRHADFGSVSSGTMNTDDLLSALASELDYQMGRQSKRFPRRELRKLVNQANRLIGDQNGNGVDVVDELFDALEQFAPPYAYFGAHEGDGADYGYWLSSELEHDFDGLKVDDTSEVPRDYRGEVLHVNDHGNLSLYVANGRGGLREIWSVV
jgi:hypothetical protein